MPKPTGNSPDKSNKIQLLTQYAAYSSIVFQMLIIIGGSFWLGRYITNYFALETPFLTLILGGLGLALAMYSTIKQLEKFQKK